MKSKSKIVGVMHLITTILGANASGMAYLSWKVDGSPAFFIYLCLSVIFAAFAYKSLTQSAGEAE